MSGYTDDAIVRHGIMDKDIVFLQKPFTFESLTRKVAEILQGPAAGAMARLRSTYGDPIDQAQIASLERSALGRIGSYPK